MIPCEQDLQAAIAEHPTPPHNANLKLVYTIIFRNRFAAISRTTTPEANSFKAFSHSSGRPALRKITPRLISIM